MRLRVVQPAFWDDERIGELSWDARLLLVGMWSYVRDEGVGKDQLGQVIGTLFPCDSDKDHEGTRLRVSAAMDELCAVGLIVRFEANGVKYVEVADWPDWQKPDKPSKRRFPSSTSIIGNPPETLASVSRDSRGTLTERSTEVGVRSSEFGVRKSDIGVQSLEEESEEPPLLHDVSRHETGGSHSASADAATPITEYERASSYPGFDSEDHQLLSEPMALDAQVICDCGKPAMTGGLLCGRCQCIKPGGWKEHA
jgi:hypothetical protein